MLAMDITSLLTDPNGFTRCSGGFRNLGRGYLLAVDPRLRDLGAQAQP